LEQTNHVAKEADAYHFNHQHILKLVSFFRSHVSVSNRRKSSDDVINTGKVDVPMFIHLEVSFYQSMDPSFRRVLSHSLHANVNPATCAQMRYDQQLVEKFGHRDHNFGLLRCHVRPENIQNGICKVIEILVEIPKFDES